MSQQITLPAGYLEIAEFAGTGFGASLAPIFIDPDSQRLAFRVEQAHGNVIGACHGGAISLFADLQICAIVRSAGLRQHARTVSLDVDYLAAATLGALLEMQVSLIRRTGSLLFTQGLMTVQGDPVARTSAIYRHFEPRDPRQASARPAEVAP